MGFKLDNRRFETSVVRLQLMNAEEYANLERVERDHWYYAGKRQLVREWLERTARIKATDTLLDCGAGTGLFAQEMEARCRVLVLDDHDESLRRLRARFRPEQVLELSGGAIPLPPASVEYVTALDVLEHVPDDGAVVEGFARVLKPGGIAIVTVPASMSLWSDWDDALHHYRRYTRAQLRGLFVDSAWEIVHANYTNTLAFPAAWVVRKARNVRAKFVPTRRVRTEDRLPPKWLNAALRGAFVGTARLRVPFPFGVSLLLVARRRASP
jgi:SAM-dependent methyltransferase